MVLSFFPATLISAVAGPEETKDRGGRVLRLIQDPFIDAEFGKNLANL